MQVNESGLQILDNEKVRELLVIELVGHGKYFWNTKAPVSARVFGPQRESSSLSPIERRDLCFVVEGAVIPPQRAAL